MLQVSAVGLGAILETLLIREVAADVRRCLARGERGQAVASVLNGVCATAFVLVLAGLLLSAAVESRS